MKTYRIGSNMDHNQIVTGLHNLRSQLKSLKKIYPRAYFVVENPDRCEMDGDRAYSGLTEREQEIVDGWL